MNVNIVMAKLLPLMQNAQAYAMKGDYLQADDCIKQFVDGCTRCYQEDNSRDGQRVAMTGYTRGAAFYAQMFTNCGESAYSFVRHDCARQWADDGIRLAYRLLCDDRDNGRNIGNSAMTFVSAVAAGFAFGKSDCVKDHMRHSDVLIEKLVNGNPQNQELALMRKNYYEARENADDCERIYQDEKPKSQYAPIADPSDDPDWCHIKGF